MAKRHIRVTCPPQLVAVGPVAQDKALGVILVFLSHPQILLGNSAALPSLDIQDVTLLTTQGELLASIPHPSPCVDHCLPIPFSAQEKESSETQVRACPAQLRPPSAAAWHSDQGRHPYKGLQALAPSLTSRHPAWPIIGAHGPSAGQAPAQSHLGVLILLCPLL